MIKAVKNLRNLILYKIGRRVAKKDKRYKILLGYLDTLYKYPELISEKKVNSLDYNDSQAALNLIIFDTHINDIERVLSLLYDENSRRMYKGELLYKLLSNSLFSPYSQQEFVIAEKKAAKLLEKDTDIKFFYNENITSDINISMTTTFIIEQYNYEPYVVVENGDIFLDCGAFFGDTAVWAAKKGAKKIYSFEPNGENFAHLQKTCDIIGKNKIMPLQYGVGEGNMKVSMIGGGGSSFLRSKMTLNACEIRDTVSVITINSYCSKNNIVPTFIKMDIEGYEMKALRGASEIIKKYKPKLAICLYHNIFHMWEIPLFIDRLGLGYTFFCKKNHPEFEFVLYCTADKK